MIELPAGLAPWAVQLAGLPADLALALAPWLGRLALAVGPLAQLAGRRTGDPDGYSGLSRRGSYERLVVGEWAVAELFPDEFLRRATEGEHLFLELARREPRGALHSVAIVSAGPAQLGAPRLAHLAALIVLARRAAAAHAGFTWGVLEDRDHRRTDLLDPAAIRRLLAARTAIAAEPGAFAAWLTAAGGEASPDVWFIGGAADAVAARQAGAACLVVRDLLEPRGRALEVEIERRGPRARLRLELPAPELCVRLLRDPYASVAGARTAAAAGAACDVRFAPGGRRLLVQLADGGVESWPIPGSPRDKLGHVRRWGLPRGHTLVALGIGRRGVLVASVTSADPTALVLGYGASHSIRMMLPRSVAAALWARIGHDGRVAVGACALVRLRASADADLVMDVAGHLVVVLGFTLWPPEGTVLIAVLLNPVGPRAKIEPERAPRAALAAAFYRTTLVWAERRDSGAIQIVEASASGNRPVATVEAGAAAAVWFGFTSPPRSASWGVAAIARGDKLWTIVAPDLVITMPAEDRVVGVRLRGAVPALLTQPQPDRLAWLERDHTEVLPRAAAPIVATAVCPQLPQVAWVTEAGEVVVYSMEHKAVVMRRIPEVVP